MSSIARSRSARLLAALALILLVAASLATFSLFAASSRISESEKAAYIALAERIPADAAFTAMAARLDTTCQTLNSILKRYQSVDRSFQYDKFTSSLKGGLGFNPLSSARSVRHRLRRRLRSGRLQPLARRPAAHQLAFLEHRQRPKDPGKPL